MIIYFFLLIFSDKYYKNGPKSTFHQKGFNFLYKTNLTIMLFDFHLHKPKPKGNLWMTINLAKKISVLSQICMKERALSFMGLGKGSKKYTSNYPLLVDKRLNPPPLSTSVKLKGEQKNQGRLKVWKTLNPKRGGLGPWNFTNLFIWSYKQVCEVSGF